MFEYWWIDYALLGIGAAIWVIVEIRYRKRP